MLSFSHIWDVGLCHFQVMVIAGDWRVSQQLRLVPQGDLDSGEGERLINDEPYCTAKLHVSYHHVQSL